MSKIGRLPTRSADLTGMVTHSTSWVVNQTGKEPGFRSTQGWND